MRTSEIRQRWLDYFASQDHAIVPSVPLVSPDPSILFTIAGMVPFIPYILGTEQAPWPRAASVQKCIRTNDIDNVGRTTRHGTFFQMNGNFSFGDYFKEGAIRYAHELLTGPVADGKYGIDPDKLWVTIWEEDAESYDVLTRGVNLDPDHIVKLTREQIFWDTGQPGPAGPCAEWHIDRGPEFGPDALGGTVDPGGDRYVEVWNLVFDQYLRGEGTGKDYPLLGELQEKAIDTGAGLERLAYILQGKANMYEIDEVYPVIAAAEEMSGLSYAAKQHSEDGVRMRVIADHVRSAMMLVGDGVRPGNDGRGYVLRRLVRRAVRSMRLLGVDEASLPVLLPASMNAMKQSYPELETDFARISEVLYTEEDAFRRTLVAGTSILDLAVGRAQAQARTGRQPRLTGQDVFTLHDTYGFPVDLTLEIAAEAGVEVDRAGFDTLMAEQKARARADALAKKSGHVDARVYNDLLQAAGGPIPFLGYTDTQAAAQVVGILVDGETVPVATAPADVEVVLTQTPFYAEAGGQLADHGVIRLAGGGIVEVDDVQKPVAGLIVHRGRLIEGDIHLDEAASAEINVVRRGAIARAHTATHMVHQVLMEEFGKETTQAGSENAPNRMRFDFRYGQALSADALATVEGRVNERLIDNLEITDQIMDLDAAKALGAQALFGEKYGRQVRVVSIGGDWSRELCGGTHVAATGAIGRVSVLGESSIGSGVRRIEALVGAGAYLKHAQESGVISELASVLGGTPEELPGRVANLVTRLKSAEKELARLQESVLRALAPQIAAEAEEIAGARLARRALTEAPSADAVRALVLAVREQLGDEAPTVVAITAVVSERPVVVVATNAQARERGMKAGDLVRRAAQVLGGGGGGKPDLAQGGGQDASQIGQALDAIAASLRN
ncbi:alanine--tRNA ligase [Buchananella hordeovulneris]|uniref:alanine--tRNA ligase n=1 Tax=Buchananella hordeovulneris TaxID=52770 RepID=UPI000F5F7735|nr:alanine--tRNA ligase [Buchananella hordeovulneris]MDO5079647.1 alanine--tRNA ligase [Buchananella hordeovulneris]RRD45371.1 alanine--tRNA ligase [Buchananella hordeovulneris]